MPVADVSPDRRALLRRARLCFAVAARTDHPGERQAALDRGEELLRQACTPSERPRRYPNTLLGALERLRDSGRAARDRVDRFHQLAREARQRDLRRAAGLAGPARIEGPR